MTPKGFRFRVEGSEFRVESLDNCSTFQQGTAVPEMRLWVSIQVTIHQRMGSFWGPKGYIRVSQIRVPIVGVPIIRTIIFWGLF